MKKTKNTLLFLAISLSICSIPVSSTNNMKLSEQPEILQHLNTEKYVRRVPEEETNNTIVYERVDGNYEMLIYDGNIKYSEDNKIFFKSNDIVDYTDTTEYAYTNKANDIKLFLPKSLDEGWAAIKKDDYEVKIKSIDSNKSNSKGIVKKTDTESYIDYGSMIISPKYSGTVIELAAGESVTLDYSGLIASTKTDGNILLYDNKKPVLEIEIENNDGNVEISDTGEMVVTASSYSTKTIYINSSSYDTWYYDDTLFSNSVNSYCGSELWCGDSGSTGKASVLISVRGITIKISELDLAVDRIINSTLTLRCSQISRTDGSSGSASCNLSLYEYTGKELWSSYNGPRTYSHSPYSLGNLVTQKTVSSGGYVNFDITKYVQGTCKNDASYTQRGMIMVNNTANTLAKFHPEETNTADYKPYFSLTYRPLDSTSTQFNVEKVMSGTGIAIPLKDVSVYLYPNNKNAYVDPKKTDSNGRVFFDLSAYPDTSTFAVNFYLENYMLYRASLPKSFLGYINTTTLQASKSVFSINPLKHETVSYFNDYQNYGWRYGLNGQIEYHKGADIFESNINGKPVYALGNGVVKGCGNNDGIGRYVDIAYNTSSGEYWVRYQHLSSYTVKVNDPVNANKIVGYVGGSGGGSGDYTPHLHVEVFQTPTDSSPYYSNTSRLDPYGFFPGYYAYRGE